MRLDETHPVFHSSSGLTCAKMFFPRHSSDSSRIQQLTLVNFVGASLRQTSVHPLWTDVSKQPLNYKGVWAARYATPAMYVISPQLFYVEFQYTISYI